MFAQELDLAPLERVLDEFKGQKGAIIPILQRAQEIYGYLPGEVLAAISKKAGIPISRLYGVATFYAQFRLTRRGRHLIKICDGTACHVRGAAKIVEGIESALNVPPGGSDPDFKYSVEIVYCLGSCGLAPIAVVDDKVYGQTDANNLVAHVKQLE
ncbi:MAG: NADH:ubiquinone oxidoreductase 24 kD subunit [Anaerolineaceae bacterium]|nr:MAG: NADH:ubiquinone oxidoreductase 24 kD subunit [Anaerolineaceae bacterium]